MGRCPPTRTSILTMDNRQMVLGSNEIANQEMDTGDDCAESMPPDKGFSDHRIINYRTEIPTFSSLSSPPGGKLTEALLPGTVTHDRRNWHTEFRSPRPVSSRKIAQSNQKESA